MTETENKAGVTVDGSTVTITNMDRFKEHLERMRAKGRKLSREVYDFAHTFSEEEKAQRAAQLARACKERNELEDSKKSVMSDFKAKIDSKTAEINLITTEYTNGYEFLTKSCEVLKDFDKGVKEYFYEGIKVGEAKMKSGDYQEVIDFAESEQEVEE
jgi:hypothetical protein